MGCNVLKVGCKIPKNLAAQLCERFTVSIENTFYTGILQPTLRTFYSCRTAERLSRRVDWRVSSKVFCQQTVRIVRKIGWKSKQESICQTNGFCFPFVKRNSQNSICHTNYYRITIERVIGKQNWKFEKKNWKFENYYRASDWEWSELSQELSKET